MEGGKDNHLPAISVRLLFPLFLLVAGLAATALGTYLVQENVHVRNRQHLLEGVHQIEETIQSRMEAYISLLRGGAGVFAAKELISQAEFRRFFERLEIPARYPGIQGYGYSVRIPKEKLAATIQLAHRQGMTNFDVWPGGQRAEYHAIVYLEPEDERNRSALGFDMFTEPARRRAMESARDSGNAAISGKVKLVQELSDTEPQPGFLLYLPVYFGGEVPRSVEERRKNLQGFIYSPFRAGNLFGTMLSGEFVPGLAFAIWDGTNCVPENLLYKSHRRFDAPIVTRKVEIAGRSWTIGFSPLSSFGKAPGGRLLLLIPVLGLIGSVLVSFLAYREASARRRSELSADQLFRQREWFDVTLASIVDAVITTDTFGRIEFMNAAAEDITGESLERAKGRPIAEFFSITDERTRRPLPNPAEKVLSTGEVIRYTQPVLLRTRTGIEKGIDPSGAPIRDHGNELLGAVLVFRETTERRKYERRSIAQHAVTTILSESSSLMDALPKLLQTIGMHLQFEMGVWWRFDDTGRTAHAEQVWHLADPRLEQFARTSLAFQPRPGEGLPGRVWTERKAVVVEDLSEAADSVRARSAKDAGLCGLLVFPVLTEARIYGALEFIGRHRLEMDPELFGVFAGLGQQIGQFIERKKSEQALAESEELYRAITETAADGVIVVDEESRIVAVNAAVGRIFGYSSEELCGHSLSRLMPERMRGGCLDGIRHFVHTSEKRRAWTGMEVPGLRKDGTEVPLEISFGAAKRAGKLLFTGLIRDITERKRAEEAIRELNQELEIRVQRRTAALLESKEQMEAFSYSVAHDLRAPLRAMQGFAHALLEDYDKALDAEGQDYLRRIMVAAERMDVLIQDLLSYSQLSRSELTLGNVSLKDAVSAAIAHHAADIAAKSAQINVDVTDWNVRAHAPTLENAISNLVSNSLKFIPAGTLPKIEIVSAARPPFVRVTVHDNGIGIAPEHQERIFRLFERLHGQEEYPGTGIGLAIVKKGIERMGGRVGITSQPGAGTTFWIDVLASGT